MTRRTVTFSVWGVAQPKGSAKAFFRPGMKYPVVTSTNKNLKQWEALVATAAQRHAAGAFFEGPVQLDVLFYLPRPKSLSKKAQHHLTRPDLDKCVRAVKDAITGKLWRDDSQVVQLQAWKAYAAPGQSPSVVITVADADPTPIEQPLFEIEESDEPVLQA